MRTRDVPADLDETARIILLDFVEERDALPYTQGPGPRALYARLIEEGFGSDDLASHVGALWGRYMGFDGGRPTHDISTGRML